MASPTLTPQALEPGLPVEVPVGSPVVLDDQRTSFVRVAHRDGDATPVVLLHGLTASAGINWMHLFGPLAQHRTVIAPDLRGHARGVRGPKRFAMADNATDVIDLLDRLGVEQAIVFGFSMGGAVAQALAHGHPDRVSGVVLHATSSSFRMAPISKRLYGVNPLAVRLADRLPAAARHHLLHRAVDLDDPALRHFIVDETRRHSARWLVRAADALHRFRSTDWIGELTQPAAMVVASGDRSLSPRLQQRLADRLAARPDVETHALSTPSGHSGVIWEPGQTVEVLVDAVERVAASVARRAD